MAVPMIRFIDVGKTYPRGGVALQHASFSIAKGEFAFLTGPSGSGKSTILKLCYLEEWPTSGEVRISGFTTASGARREVPYLRRRVGVVFQSFRLLPDRTAEQNVAFALEVTGAPRSTIRDRAARALAQVGLASKGTALPHELSGGEQQRVAIARALVHQPLVLLADEPTGNLDDRASRGVFQLLREINAAGTAVLMATHNLDLVGRSGMRVIELSRGRIAFDSAESPQGADAPEGATDASSTDAPSSGTPSTESPSTGGGA